MEVVATGTGGAGGWPEPGCRCASCLLASHETPRGRSSIVVDGVLRLGMDGPAWEDAAWETTAWETTDGENTDGENTGEHATGEHVVRAVPGGWEVTAPDRKRLLYLPRPGAAPDPDGTYDIAFVDVLGDPFRLGRLRAAKTITDETVVLAACADHRVRSREELERLCAIWRVALIDDGQGLDGGGRDTDASYDKKTNYRVLVLGGARSGKSERAELRVAAEPAVTYVATGLSGSGDPDWAARIEAHRARRPAWWRTVETTDLSGLLATATDTLLIDGIGTWLAAVMDECGAWTGATERLAERIDELIAAWRQTRAHVVAVSDETGLGVIPATPAGRLFRDWLGRVNQALAAESEVAELVVAGRVLPLDG